MKEIVSIYESLAPKPGHLRWLMQGLILAGAYFLSAMLGLSFSTVATNVTLLWPPTGLALFALLVFGVRLWPAVFLAALVANLTTDIPALAAFLIAVGNCLEAVAGFYLLRAAGFQKNLQRVRDVVMLVVLAAGVSTMFSASVGALVLASFNIISWNGFGYAWATWWMGDAMGDLVIASFLLAWWGEPRQRWELRRIAEGVALLLCLIGITQLVFGGHIVTHPLPLPLAFMTFPLLTWAALRFGMRGATIGTLVVGVVTLANILLGHGLFVRASVMESLVLLWLYTNVLAVTSMVLAASVAERQLAEERMRHLAQNDILTGLPNRATLQTEIDLAIRRADRHLHMVGVLFVDIDRFKVVNDTLGHSVGDKLLSQIGTRLRAGVRQDDIVTRHGGDEFVILLEGLTQIDDASRVASKVLDGLRKAFVIDGIPLHMTGSIGICLYPHNGHDADTLLKNADTAMYRAKDIGRNNFVFYSADMNAQMAARLTMENELREALERGEFFLHYQPQYDVVSGQVIAVEALLRWHRAGGVLVPPGEFIGLLEEIGLINRVGAWVLDMACEQLAEWRGRGVHGIRMSVNVSSYQLGDPELPRQVAVALAKRQLSASLLELEITESMLVRQGPVVEQIIQQLVDLGVRLAVDDFGTGYSSLSYLHRLSIDTLKIDRAFVADLPDSENSAAIARAIIGLGKSLHLTLVAEGVETVEQRNFLSALDCNIMQGYLLSHAVSAAECLDLIHASRLPVAHVSIVAPQKSKSIPKLYAGS